MNDCLFCKIAAGNIPAKIVYETDLCCAFEDITPVAPLHILIIPKKHMENLHSMDENDSPIREALFSAISHLVEKNHLTQSGYRLVINSGDDGQQSVPHLHIHLIGKRSLQWPPG
ncbi:histidine triad nucleotide-binding protein [Chitinivibrio alkaliphilus]|uniref:Protein Kinase C Interacting protein related (PKCI) protein n=1 Tax=Chitinivibrio alkaliphilus ACht1 TaxID=1313304 RepID=U7D6Z1_9BACT|nr:histidine triad nucleotide-binding protein [Chitinivibrio alkaliphilus]ERP31713.1 Protein Kinase C Interacting protein related (PKCI) protein [Chitinivibrio alkaliphilus ACht1]